MAGTIHAIKSYELLAAKVAVTGDRDRLVQVMVNLISNAVKFSPPDGIVSLEVLRNDRTLTVAVSDAGPGFSSDVIRAIRSGSATVPSRGSSGKRQDRRSHPYGGSGRIGPPGFR